MERRRRAATLSGTFVLIVAVILVVGNVLAYSVNARWDATKNERYTLSKGSARLVSEGLKENLLAKLYVTRGLPKHDVFVEELIDLMKEYEQASGGKLTYQVLEPKTDEERQAAKDDGLQEAAFGEGSETGDQQTFARGFMGIVFEYGSEREVIPMLSPEQTQGLEFWVTNKIRELRDRADDIDYRIGVIKKEGMKLDDANLVPPQGGQGGPNIKGILTQAFPFYTIEEVDLDGGKAEIDPALKGVIVLQPDKDYTDAELQRIDQFLMRGDKALLVVAGAVNMKAAEPTMKAELDLRGLDKLLAGYGVEMKKEAVLDWGRSLAVPVVDDSGRVGTFPFPAMLQVQHNPDLEGDEQLLDNTFPGFFRLDELGFPFPSTLVPHPEKQPQAEVKVVARSSPKSTVDTGSPIDMRGRLRQQGEFGSRAVAITVEGKLASAFGGEGGEGIDIPKESAAPSRVLVISAPQFLANPFARAGNPPPMPPQMMMMGQMGGDPNLQRIAVPYAQKYLTGTILAFKNMLDWMSGDADLIAVSAKLLGDPNLTFSSIDKPEPAAEKSEDEIAKEWESYKAERKKVQNKVQWWLTLLPSLLFVFIGVGRWRWRESQRDKVKL